MSGVASKVRFVCCVCCVPCHSRCLRAMMLLSAWIACVVPPVASLCPPRPCWVVFLVAAVGVVVIIIIILSITLASICRDALSKPSPASRRLPSSPWNLQPHTQCGGWVGGWVVMALAAIPTLAPPCTSHSPSPHTNTKNPANQPHSCPRRKANISRIEPVRPVRYESSCPSLGPLPPASQFTPPRRLATPTLSNIPIALANQPAPM